MHKFFGLILLVVTIVFVFFAYNKLPQYFGRDSDKSDTQKPPAFQSKIQLAPVIVRPEKSVVSAVGSAVSNLKKVKISGIRPAGSGRNYSEISLSGNLQEGEKVNITGWRIQSNKKYFFIPKGTEIYEPGGLSASQDIYLRRGEKAQLYSNTSRVGLNFKLNKCTGYLETAGSFTPPLPKNCPRANRSEIVGFSGACQDYSLNLRTCMPASDNPPVPFNDQPCRDFLKTFTYLGCFERYRNDADFLSREWKIWLGDSFGNQVDILDPRHDQVRLYDEKGNLVDEYTY